MDDPELDALMRGYQIAAREQPRPGIDAAILRAARPAARRRLRLTAGAATAALLIALMPARFGLESGGPHQATLANRFGAEDGLSDWGLTHAVNETVAAGDSADFPIGEAELPP